MKHRLSRTNTGRKTFRIDSLLERITAQKLNRPLPNGGGQMEIHYMGFYDKAVEGDQLNEYAQVETLLLKICHKKRKDSSSPLMEISLGTNQIEINPVEETVVDSSRGGVKSHVCVPNESFTFSNGHLVKSYILLLRVQTHQANTHVIGKLFFLVIKISAINYENYDFVRK